LPATPLPLLDEDLQEKVRQMEPDAEEKSSRRTIKQWKKMKQLKEGEDFYYNPDGLMVLTEKYHRREGIVAAMDAGIAPLIMTAFRNPAVAITGPKT